METHYHLDHTITAPQALAFARHHYSVGDEVIRLKGYSDQNFLIKHEGQPRWVLKFTEEGNRDRILGQFQAIAHLARRAPHLSVPTARMTTAGEWLVDCESGDGVPRFAYLLKYLPGRFLADWHHGDRVLWRQLGTFFGELDRGLSGFYHHGLDRAFEWDLAHGPETCLRNLPENYQTDRKGIVRDWVDRYCREAVPLLAGLPKSVIHNDGNEQNILMTPSGQVSGLIDLGDMVYSHTIFELAILIAYSILDQTDPMCVATEILAGYHSEYPVSEPELKVLFHAIGLRLCVSVCMSARAHADNPNNEYLLIDQKPAWAMLEQLTEIHPRYAYYRFRRACNLPVLEHQQALVHWLKMQADQFAPIMATREKLNQALVLDLSKGGRHTWSGDEEPARATKRLFSTMRKAAVEVSIGEYNEDRGIYDLPAFANADGERRTVHLGIDLFQPAESPVFAPLDGVVHSVVDHDQVADYGPTIILEHRPGGMGFSFYTLYGHLNEASLSHLARGQEVVSGQLLGWLGDVDRNGGWPPHLHFQLIGDMLEYEDTFPGVVAPSERAFWRELCPDPNLILGLPQLRMERFRSVEELKLQRRALLGPSLSLAYDEPLQIVCGRGAHLYDKEGRAYLDGINNVCHVGHAHPRVVVAANAQMAQLNTNTRYLHDHVVTYAKRLLATFPDPLEVVYFVCTGSEANELAWRMAQTHTGGTDALVIDHAYHGHTSNLIGLSPYKFNAKGRSGCPDWVQVVQMPDGFRGPLKYGQPNLGAAYANYLDEALAKLEDANKPLAAFFAESIPGCGGQIILPNGYLQAAYDKVRAHGGLCIADEVQVGFGRVGSHYWAFEEQGIVPDIVTLGKPIGNGHPMAAVVTTRAIADSFANGMEYFNTFGGNPVSAAVGIAVLDVIEEEQLLAHALEVGLFLKNEFERLQLKHALIGDVRGRGLFLGLELVRDRNTLEPAAIEAGILINRMKARGFLLSTDGPLHNVIKIKPPLVIRKSDAALLVKALDEVFCEGFSSFG